MKFLLLSLILILNYSGISQAKTITICDLKLRNHDGLYYKKFTNKPYEGFVDGKCTIESQSYLDGKVTKTVKGATGNLKKGKKDREWLIYNRFGGLAAIHNYKEGKLFGQSQIFDVGGSLTHLREFKNGMKHGYEIVYDNKKVKSKSEFKDDKIWNGDIFQYAYKSNYRKSHLELKGNLKKGKLDGKLIEYNKDKTILNIEKWQNGKLISKSTIDPKVKKPFTTYMTK